MSNTTGQHTSGSVQSLVGLERPKVVHRAANLYPGRWQLTGMVSRRDEVATVTAKKSGLFVKSTGGGQAFAAAWDMLMGDGIWRYLGKPNDLALAREGRRRT